MKITRRIYRRYAGLGPYKDSFDSSTRLKGVDRSNRQNDWVVHV